VALNRRANRANECPLRGRTGKHILVLAQTEVGEQQTNSMIGVDDGESLGNAAGREGLIPSLLED
jgi:hypothetical protein